MHLLCPKRRTGYFLKDLEGENLKTSSTCKIQKENFIQVERLEKRTPLQNCMSKIWGREFLFKIASWRFKKLIMFMLGSKYLDIILVSKQAIYSKVGLGYKSNSKKISYISLVSRNAIKLSFISVKAWMPKQFLINKNRPNI